MKLYLLVFALLLVPQFTYADIRPLTEKEVLLAIIHTKATQYNVDKESIIKTLQCESRFNIDAYNPKDSDGLPAIGISQFKEKTFYNFAKQMGLQADIENPVDQIDVMTWAFSKGYARHWGCYNKLYPKSSP